MKKANFSNQLVYWLIIVLLSGLIISNIINTISSGRLIGILPIAIQAGLLTLVLHKNQYAKIGVKIWVLIFMILASGLQFVGQLLQDAANNFAGIKVQYYLSTGFKTLLGIVIVIAVNRTVHIKEIENNPETRID